MTVIVGIRCKDGGIVIGADSASTFVSADQNRTIEQSIDKIRIISGQVIIAGTGEVGLGQRFAWEAEKIWKEGACKNRSHIEAGIIFSQVGINNFRQTGLSNFGYGALVAFPILGSNHLCEYSLPNFQPEHKQDGIFFVSMGGGQQIVDPFLGFLRKALWKNEPPNTTSQGIFSVLWALDHAIELNPGGINGPARIATLTNKGARLCSDDELAEHRQQRESLYEYISDFSKQPTKPLDIPKPPKI